MLTSRIGNFVLNILGETEVYGGSENLPPILSDEIEGIEIRKDPDQPYLEIFDSIPNQNDMKEIVQALIFYSHIGGLKRLLRRGDVSESIGRYRYFDSSTIIHLALLYKSKVTYDIIKILIEKYPELINERDDYGRTPLYHAVSFGFPECRDIVELLMKNGGDPEIKCFLGKTPIEKFDHFYFVKGIYIKDKDVYDDVIYFLKGGERYVTKDARK